MPSYQTFILERNGINIHTEKAPKFIRTKTVQEHRLKTLL